MGSSVENEPSGCDTTLNGCAGLAGGSMFCQARGRRYSARVVERRFFRRKIAAQELSAALNDFFAMKGCAFSFSALA